jgi:hypothetical protein
MDTSALHRTAFRFLILFCVLTAPTAHAALLTFDDLSFNGTSSRGLPARQNYRGFIWDSKWSVGNTNKSGFIAAAHSGTQFLFNEGATRNLSVSRDTPFDSLGARFTAPGSGYMPASFVRVDAYDAHNSLLGSTSYFQIVSGGAWLDTTNFGDVFTGISRLVIDPFGGAFPMDNFSFLMQGAVVSVNDAGSWMLMLIGVFCLWVVRRRSRT